MKRAYANTKFVEDEFKEFPVDRDESKKHFVVQYYNCNVHRTFTRIVRCNERSEIPSIISLRCDYTDLRIVEVGKMVANKIKAGKKCPVTLANFDYPIYVMLDYTGQYSTYSENYNDPHRITIGLIR